MTWAVAVKVVGSSPALMCLVGVVVLVATEFLQGRSLPCTVPSLCVVMPVLALLGLSVFKTSIYAPGLRFAAELVPILFMGLSSSLTRHCAHLSATTLALHTVLCAGMVLDCTVDDMVHLVPGTLTALAFPHSAFAGCGSCGIHRRPATALLSPLSERRHATPRCVCVHGCPGLP